MPVQPIADIIPETHIVMFAPHYDDFLLGLGGYALELREQNLLAAKTFTVVLVFSRSNYQNNSGKGNFDTSLERIKMATGRRIIEELDCLDDLLGPHAYRYEILGERECMLRGKVFADSELEFPHGMYPDFQPEDWEILERLKRRVRAWAEQADTALVLPLAIKEHIDHFLTREAGIAVAEEGGVRAKAAFYFQEDRPYAGLQTPEERERIRAFLESHPFQPRVYRYHPAEIAALAFTHYTSQVDETYRKGILTRAEELQHIYQSEFPCDQIFRYQPEAGVG
jgi:hypothetical protein